MSSIYETPISSPTYATPLESTSPWASPRTSLRSDNSTEPPIITNTVMHNSLQQDISKQNKSPSPTEKQNTSLSEKKEKSPTDGANLDDGIKASLTQPPPTRGLTVQNSTPFTG